jgi:hypothetical protein
MASAPSSHGRGAADDGEWTDQRHKKPAVSLPNLDREIRRPKHFEFSRRAARIQARDRRIYLLVLL